MRFTSMVYYLIPSILMVQCTSVKNDNTNCGKHTAGYTMQGALLGTRFQSLEELQVVLQIEYVNRNTPTDTITPGNAKVIVTHCSNGKKVIAELSAGTNENDIRKAQYGTTKTQIAFLVKSPYSVSVRKDLEKVFLLARLRPALFGEGDVAFLNIAGTMARNINTPELAFLHPRDSTEKGYLNTFNHITAQAFITTLFSEALADFVADAHERANHPELITGNFTQEKLQDLAEGPVDNYTDIVNNEWGQELGKQLKVKYKITNQTIWTPQLLTDYLNDIQAYYSWAFQIGFIPYKPNDEQVVKFSKKINAVMAGASYAAFE